MARTCRQTKGESQIQPTVATQSYGTDKGGRATLAVRVTRDACRPYFFLKELGSRQQTDGHAHGQDAYDEAMSWRRRRRDFGACREGRGAVSIVDE